MMPLTSLFCVVFSATASVLRIATDNYRLAAINIGLLIINLVIATN